MFPDESLNEAGDIDSNSQDTVLHQALTLFVDVRCFVYTTLLCKWPVSDPSPGIVKKIAIILHRIAIFYDGLCIFVLLFHFIEQWWTIAIEAEHFNTCV